MPTWHTRPPPAGARPRPRRPCAPQPSTRRCCPRIFQSAPRHQPHPTTPPTPGWWRASLGSWRKRARWFYPWQSPGPRYQEWFSAIGAAGYARPATPPESNRPAGPGRSSTPWRSAPRSAAHPSGRRTPHPRWCAIGPHPSRRETPPAAPHHPQARPNTRRCGPPATLNAPHHPRHTAQMEWWNRPTETAYP